MATYKLIQDIEAEDHILGPLTLRQFIFALVGVFCFYICFIAIAKHAAFLLVLFLPPALFCLFFAVPFGRDQPTEIWALAKLRFWFKPRRRIWDQSGVKELVTITVPKKIEHVLTNGLSQNEVQSRLKALANTIDSRGWAIKNVNVNSYARPNPLATADSDRLIDISNVPQEVPGYDVQAADDILDETSNPIAQQFDNMITESTQSHRKQLINELNDIRTNQAPQASGNPADYWFMNQSQPVPANGPAPIQAQAAMTSNQPTAPAASVSLPPIAATPAAAPNDAALSARLRAQSNSGHTSYAHMRTLQPIATQPATQTPQIPQPATTGAQNPATTVTPPSDPAILSLANNNDLNVSTLAREAYKAKNGDEPPQDEVVISLH